MEDEQSTHQEYSSKEWRLLNDLQASVKEALRQHDQGRGQPVEQVLDLAETLLSKARAGDTPPIKTHSPAELIESYWTHIEQRRESATTGLPGLNDALGGGLESKRLVVLLGAPGAGKTALANQIADHVANGGRPVLYITSEDIPFTLLAKTLARIGNVNYTAVLKGWQSERERITAALVEQVGRLSSERLAYVDATQGLTIDAMRELARAHFADYAKAGQGVLVVDYLQRFARAQRDLLAAGRDLREVVTVLTERLRALACELDCCVVALASQNRASGYGAGGQSSALASAKESGDIEYTADVIMALVEDTTRKAQASFLKPRLLRIDKNRQGDTTAISLDWQGDRQRFTEAAK